MKLSVILCCYNNVTTIRQAAESVLYQTHPDMELVLIANGSTDGSAEIMRELAATHPGHILLLDFDRNEAVVKRCNQGIEVSSGKFISFLYADDFLNESWATLSLAALKDAPWAGVVHSPGWRLYPDGRLVLDRNPPWAGGVLERMLKYWDTEGFINPISPVIRRECFKNLRFYEDSLVEGEGIFVRLAARYPFVYLPRPLVTMRDHAKNLGKDIRRNRQAFIYIMERLRDHEMRLLPHLATLHLKLTARILRRYGWMGIRQLGDPVWARECFRLALAWDRSAAMHWKFWVGGALSFLPQGLVKYVHA